MSGPGKGQPCTLLAVLDGHRQTLEQSPTTWAVVYRLPSACRPQASRSTPGRRAPAAAGRLSALHMHALHGGLGAN